jgi:hypothetical protein
VAAATHQHREAFDRRVGKIVEEGADATPLGRADAPFDDDPDRARTQVGNQIGQLVVRGAQVDLAAQGFVQEGRVGDGAAVGRAGRAGTGVELGPRAYLADVVLGQEQLVGEVDPDPLQVGVPRTARGEGGAQGRVGAAPGGAEQAQDVEIRNRATVVVPAFRIASN